MADDFTMRRPKDGLVRLLGRSLAAATFGILAFSGGIGTGAGIVAYLEQNGTLMPSAEVVAKRPSAQVAFPEPRPANEEPVVLVQTAALLRPTPVDPPAATEAAPASAPSVIETPAVAPAPEAAPAPDPSVSPAWMVAAVPVSVPRDRPMVAIIIDDLAVDQVRSRRAIDLPGPLTMSFLPYGSNLDELAAAARERGHEIMVHLPMEPHDPEADPGPHALMNALDADEIRARLKLNLTAIDGYVGVNNHMGSKFSSWEQGMRPVMEAIRRRGLIYVDSLTTPETVAADLATSMEVPYLARDVFLDYDGLPATVEQQLGRLERIAKVRGYAIGIGHPYDGTLEVVNRWLETAADRGFAVVPVSTIARLNFALPK